MTNRPLRSGVAIGLMMALLAFLAAGCGAAQDAIAESEVGDASGDGNQQSPEPEESDNNTSSDTDSASSDTEGASSYSDETSAGGNEASGDAALDLSAPVVVEGEITVPLDANQYTFNGQAGDAISIDITALNNGACTDTDLWDLNLEILDPTGDEAKGGTERVGIWGCQPFGPWTLDTDGTHTITFTGGEDDPYLGTYTATISRLPRATTEVDLSAPVVVEGEITVPLDANQYTFNGQAGDAISIDITALNNGACTDTDLWDLNLEILDPTGDEAKGGTERVGIWGCQPFGPWTLDTDGTHTITFTGGEDDPYLGTYTATISRLGG